MTKPTLNEIRDDLGTDFYKKASPTNKEFAFEHGFDAGVSEMKKRAQVLVSYLEYLIENEYYNVAKNEHSQALEEYRKSVE